MNNNNNNIMHNFKSASIEDAVQDFANGKFLIVMDDETRENEGDLIIAAESINTEKMAFMVKYTSGFICVPLSTERAKSLNLNLMIPENKMTDRHGTAYTVTVDYKYNTTTGISAHDRALTALKLSDNLSNSNDFLKPGHVCPLIAKLGLLRERRGHTEAAIQLCKLSNLQSAAVLCELVRENDGLMMRLPDCIEFSNKFDIKIITIKAIVNYIY